MRRSLAVPALVAAATGCFFEPKKPGAAADARSDTPVDGPVGPTPTVRKIASAWYTADSTPSTGMTANGYSIPTTGINDGDLVLFIGNIDNGNNGTWSLPTVHFHQLAQVNYGTDGQTFFAAWTKASNEPGVYAQLYNGGLNSAASAITLLAVTGADPTTPIEAAPYNLGSGYEDPVVLASDGVTTTAPNSLVIFAGGADWAGSAMGTFMPPPGYDALDALGDRGGLTFLWTSLLTAKKAVPTVGATGAEMGSIATAPGVVGMPWTIEIAIAPAP